MRCSLILMLLSVMFAGCASSEMAADRGDLDPGFGGNGPGDNEQDSGTGGRGGQGVNADAGDYVDAGANPSAPDGGAVQPPADAGRTPPDDHDGGLPPDGADAGPNELDGGTPELDFESLLWRIGAPDAGVPSPRVIRSRQLNESYRSPCGDTIKQGQVLTWTADSSGTLNVQVATSTPHLQMFQLECGSLTSTKTCAPEHIESALNVEVIAGQELCWLVGFEGEASVLAQVAPAECGDGVVNSDTEQCDYGDRVPGDGCDENCRFEIPGVNDGDTCPGVAQGIFDEVTLNGFTVGYADHAPATCGALSGAADKQYRVIPTRAGRLTLRLDADFDAVLSVFTSCSDFLVSDLLACSDQPLAHAIEQVDVSVEKDAHYFVAVDGYAPGQQGAYSLSMTLVP